MPSDTQRLNWLRKNKWVFYSADCFQLNWRGFSFARHSIRKSIDSAMKIEGKK